MSQGDDPGLCWICGEEAVTFEEFCPKHLELTTRCNLDSTYYHARRHVGNRTDETDQALMRIFRDIEES
jgi:hypothetical protein